MGSSRRPRRQSAAEVLDVMRLVWAVDHGLQARSKRMQHELGITGPQRLVIRILGRSPGISPGRLADVLHIHPSTLTGVLARLNRRKLVRRGRDPADRRRAQLTLTDAGRDMDRIRRGTVEDALSRTIDSLSPGDLAAFRRSLVLFAAELDGAGPAAARLRRRR
jgi:DNA-binding MarR family transcriptional regulator